MKKLVQNAKSKLLFATLALNVSDFLPDPLAELNDLSGIIRTILNALFGFAGLIAVFYLIYGGYLYITSGGGEGAENAKKTILNAIIGLIVILAALALVNFVWSRITGQGIEYQEIPEGTL